MNRETIQRAKLFFFSKQNVNWLYNNVELCVLTSKTKAKQSTTASH